MQSKTMSAEPGIWSTAKGPCRPWGWLRSSASSKMEFPASEPASVAGAGGTSGRLPMGALQTSQILSPCRYDIPDKGEHSNGGPPTSKVTEVIALLAVRVTLHLQHEWP